MVPARVEFTVDMKFQFLEHYEKLLGKSGKSSSMSPCKVYKTDSPTKPVLGKKRTKPMKFELGDEAEVMFHAKRQHVDVPTKNQTLLDEKTLNSEIRSLTCNAFGGHKSQRGILVEKPVNQVLNPEKREPLSKE